MGLSFYLSLPAFQHALLATTLVAISSGLIGPFVVARGAAFAVHGVSELAFTSAIAGLLIGHDPVLGAILGSLVVATAFGILGRRERERDSAIGATLAFGLGVGVYLLSRYNGQRSVALNVLFGQILGINNNQLLLLVGVAVGVVVAVLVLFRPLLFASVDPDVADARGVPTRFVGLLFLYVLAVTVTEAAQVVGTLLVLSLAITPAAAAVRISARPATLMALSVLFALIASDGGLLLSTTHPNVAPSAFITTISFAIYVLARVTGAGLLARRRRTPTREAAAHAPAATRATEP